MSQLSVSLPSARFGGWSSGLMSLVRDTTVVVDAILFPGRIIAEVHQMRALHLQAARIEATDPQAAAALRQRASRIGLA